jgi:hypothetical protein
MMFFTIVEHLNVLSDKAERNKSFSDPVCIKNYLNALNAIKFYS